MPNLHISFTCYFRLKPSFDVYQSKQLDIHPSFLEILTFFHDIKTIPVLQHMSDTKRYISEHTKNNLFIFSGKIYNCIFPISLELCGVQIGMTYRLKGLSIDFVMNS